MLSYPPIFEGFFKKPDELVPEKCEYCSAPFPSERDQLEGRIGNLLNVNFSKMLLLGIGSLLISLTIIISLISLFKMVFSIGSI